MQWPPAIRNYMRKVRLKYQHVIAIFPLQTASLNTKNAHAHTLYKHVYIAYKYSQFLDTSAFSLLTICREKGRRDMLIFQPYLPHIITNSRRPLHDLSHSKIILWKARFPYQHVTLKHWPPTQLIQTLQNVVACNKTFEKLLHWTNQLSSLFHPPSTQT